MKIMLIMAAAQSEPMHANNPFMPLALPLLAASAPGHTYELIDLLAGEDIDFGASVDVVGISIRFTSGERAFTIADRFRQRQIPVVLGGPQVSGDPFVALPHADAVVVGEGEQVWPVLLEDVARGTLKKFYAGSPQPFDAQGHSLYQVPSFLDLAHVPVPKRELVTRKYTFDTVFAARGCPVCCDFCAVPSLFGTSMRTRPVADVVAEIDTFRRYYYLIDDSVFGKPATYDYYVELYDAISRLKKKRYWTGQANLDAVASERGREVIRQAHRSGLLYVAVGVESLKPEILEKSGAIQKMGVQSGEHALEKMKEHIGFIQDLGIIVSGWFVLGYEEDTIESYYAAYAFCKEMHILPVIFPVNALPGTPLYEKTVRDGRLKNGGVSNIQHPTMRDDEIIKAIRFIIHDGYSLKSNLRRLVHYLPQFRKDRIHKAIFMAVLQSRLKHGFEI